MEIVVTALIAGLISWIIRHQENDNVEVFKYKTTAHNVSYSEQVDKVNEEGEEYNEAILNWHKSETPENATKVSDELNDYINTLIKLNKIFCEENNMNLKTEIKRNIKKNNNRGYYGSNTNKAE